MSDESTTLAIRHCENCGTPLQGEHCYACGQPTKGLVRHFPSILGDFVDTVFDIDGRIWRTLWPLLFRPGHLTLEYLRGHRVRFVSPVRLFVFLSVLAFLAMQWSIHWDEDTITFDPPDQFASAATEAELEAQRSASAAKCGAVSAERCAAQARCIARWRRSRRSRRRDHRHRERGASPPRSAACREFRYDTEASSTPHIAFNDRPWHPTDNPLQIDALPEVVNQKLNDWAG